MHALTTQANTSECFQGTTKDGGPVWSMLVIFHTLATHSPLHLLIITLPGQIIFGSHLLWSHWKHFCCYLCSRGSLRGWSWVHCVNAAFFDSSALPVFKVLNFPGFVLCGVCMLCLSLYGFSPGTLVSSYLLKSPS